MRAIGVLLLALPLGIIIGWRGHHWWRRLHRPPSPPAFAPDDNGFLGLIDFDAVFEDYTRR